MLSDKIKICFVIDLIESPTAGTEKQLLLLLQHLDRSKFQPYLCVLRSTEWVRTSFNLCNLYVIDTESFGTLAGWKAIYKFSRFLRHERIDVVQTYFKDGGKVGFIAAKLAGVKTIIGSRRNQGFWYTKQDLLIQKIINRGSSLLIANCENTKQWAIKTEGIQPDKIKVIYNALEVERYYRASEEQRTLFREQHDFPADAIIVGIVANLRPIKSVNTFIQAAARVVQSQTNIYFIVVGDGPDRPALEELSRVLGLTSHIRFLGKRTDIPDILSCIDIGVLSSTSESFSNAIIEYMAAGLAVVCTDVGGAREAVEDGQSGYIVKVGDYQKMAEAVVKVVTYLTATIGDCGIVKAREHYGYGGVIKSYEQVVTQLLS